MVTVEADYYMTGLLATKQKVVYSSSNYIWKEEIMKTNKRNNISFYGAFGTKYLRYSFE